jgi:hypothetical protein
MDGNGKPNRHPDQHCHDVAFGNFYIRHIHPNTPGHTHGNGSGPGYRYFDPVSYAERHA